ncbi:hypothetical protein [Zooshikella harenae]|uniref:Uncharacterized protein n=1 Tax=Zooshikella harenae TaxID=2827238 RepID=A0ABS5ZAF8_9GAMM|nr:hypothetical protein [Zooshikella harenae]MBU2711034.1 hypothetical protein [Zooshikella harenae]
MKGYSGIAIVALSTLFSGCWNNSGTPAPATPPAVLANCGAMTGTMKGVGADVTTGISMDVNTTFSLTNNQFVSIDWTVNGQSQPRDPVSGRKGSGSLVTIKPGPPPEFDVNVTIQQDGYSINITGTIVGAPTCTGHGRWTATKDSRNAGSGTWSIP